MVVHTCSQVEAAELIKAIVFSSAVAKAVLFQEGPVEYWKQGITVPANVEFSSVSAYGKSNRGTS